MPESLNISANISLQSKNVAQELKRVGDLAKQALNFNPQNKELQQLVARADDLYNSINKSTQALKTQKELETAITLQKEAQQRLDDTKSQKRNLERDITKAQNLGKEDVVATKKADLARVNEGLKEAEALVNDFTSIVATLKGKMAELSASGEDVDKSLTFDSARVASTELLNLVTQIDSVSTDIINANTANSIIVPTETIEEARQLLAEYEQNAEELGHTLSYTAENIRNFLESPAESNVSAEKFIGSVVNMRETLEQFRGVIATPEQTNALDTYSEEAEKLKPRLTALRDELVALTKGFMTLGDSFQGDDFAGALYQSTEKASELYNEFNQISNVLKTLKTNAESALSPTELEAFLTAIQPIEQSLEVVRQGFKGVVMAESDIDSVNTIDEKIEMLNNWISALQAVKDAYADVLSAEQLEAFNAGTGAQLETQLETAKQTLEELKVKQQELANTPPAVLINENTSETVNKASGKLQTLLDTYRDLKQKMDAFNSNKIQLSDQDYVQLSRDLENAGRKLDNYKAKILGTKSTMKEAIAKIREFGSAVISVFRKSISQVNSFIKAVGGRLSSAIKSLTSPLNKIKSAMDRAFSVKGLKRGLTTLLKYTIGVRSLYFAFRKLRNMVKEGIENLVQYESETNLTNQRITEMNTALLYLKNAWAAAFAPVINIALPVLNSLIIKLADTANAFARFIGSLTGQEVVLNAVKVDAQDYAESLKNAGSSAGGAADKVKKLTDRLASFDDLNVLGKDNDDDTSGGGGGGVDAYVPDPSEMFEYVDSVSTLADMVMSAINKGFDFTELGQTLETNLTNALNGINWSVIQAWAINLGHGIGTFLSGALSDKSLWVSVGDTMASGFNTAMLYVREFLNDTKNIDLGGGIALVINNFFSGVNWEDVKSNLSTFATSFVDNINSFLSGLKAEDIAEGLGTLSESVTSAIVTVLTGINYAEVVTSASSIGDAILEGIQNGLNSSDDPFAQSLGGLIGSLRDTLSTLMPVILPIVDVLLQIASAILPIISSLLSAISPIIQAIAPILQVIADLITMLSPVISSIVDALKPIIEAILPVIKSVLESLKPVIEGFTTNILPVMLESLSHLTPLISSIADLIIGVLNNSDGLSLIVTKFIGEILPVLLPLLNPIFDILTVIFDLLGALLPPLVALITPILEIALECLKPLFDNFELVADIINVAIIPFLKILASIIQITVIPSLNFFITVMNAVSQIINVVGGVMTKFRDTWKQAWDDIADKVHGVANSMIAFIEGFVNAGIDGFNRLIGVLNNFKVDIPDWVPEFGGKQFGFTLDTFSHISLPRLAQGAVIPPNKEFMAVLGDQSSGTNIEAPLDTIKQAVAEVMANNGNAEMIQLLQQLITVVENKNLTIGDKEIGKANARYTTQQNRIRGVNF